MPFLPAGRTPGSERGFTALELLLALAVLATMTTMAIPLTGDAVDELRTAAAARYLAARLRDARIGAVKRATSVALRFESEGSGYRMTPYADGNGNGVRSADITLLIDPALGGSEALEDKFPGVSLGLMNDYPDADGTMGTGADGVRIGASRILVMSPDGTATPGTLYVHGRGSQFAIRVLGATGRVRVLRYRPADGQWESK